MAGYATPAWTNDASPAIDDSALLDIGHGIELAEHPYGVCSTAAATAAKTVTIDYSGTLTLFTGLTVRVKFTNGNSADSPTLNVNSTGAIAIVYGTALAPTGTWTAGAIFEFTYDGTNWVTSRTNSFDTIPTDSSKNLLTSGSIYSALQRKANNNILENWYFVGGGSGADVFPVNQRGATTNTAAQGYFIDRWTNYGTYKYTYSLLSSGMQLTGQSNAISIASQNITPLIGSLNGQKVTLSVLTAEDGLCFASGTVSLTGSLDNKLIVYGTGSRVLATLTGSTSAMYVAIRAPQSTSITFKAIKLELGSTQTLAHYDGGWVLNEIPNYAEELLKCQRYYYNTKASASHIIAINGLRGDGTAGHNIGAQVITPVVMRSAPTVDAAMHSIRGNGSIWASNLSVSSTPLAVYGNIVTLDVQCSSASFPAYTNGYGVLFSKLILSAEI